MKAEVKCGYCGSSLKDAKPEQEESQTDLKSPQFQYTSCDHPEEKAGGEDSEDKFATLQRRKALVDVQMRSVENLERLLQEKRETLLNQLDEFCATNKDFLQNCARISRNFDANFDKLAEITVEPCFEDRLLPNIQSYFQREELQKWADTCEKSALRLLKKIESLEVELREDIIKNFKQQTDMLGQTFLPLKNKLSLHELTFKALDQERSEKKNTTSLESTLLTLVDIYGGLHEEGKRVISDAFADVGKLSKKCESLLARNKYLVTNNVAEISADSRIIAIFEDFGDIFERCVEEIKLRAKFAFVYKSVLDLLNKFAQNENTRRISFVNKFSSKIPSQIFPHIKRLSRQINIDKFFEGADEEVQLSSEVVSELKENLQQIERTLFVN